jgi:putative ABC transport system permease protein
VQTAQTRISRYATLDIEGLAEPVIAQLMSIPQDGQPQLNQLAISQGSWLTTGRDDEVIITEPFAEAHHLALGDPKHLEIVVELLSFYAVKTESGQKVLIENGG